MSRFDKYKNNGKSVADHIANVNLFINQLHDQGLDLIEAEIKDLDWRIGQPGAAPIFTTKRDQLITLGETIEKLYDTYHFNKDN